MRSTFDRIRHTIGYELIGILLCAPFASWVLGKPLLHVGTLALALSLIATAWNYFYNLAFDTCMHQRLGRTEKNWKERILHAFGFEVGLLVVSLPLAAWWLSMSILEALWLDIGLVVFYFFYALFYNLAYDRIFPIPRATGLIAAAAKQ